MKKSHLDNIDFFRILFTITIVYGHIIQHYMMPQFGQDVFFTNLMKHTSYAFGYMCDMFFILSGFFMFFSYEKSLDFKELISRKVARLWPVLFFSLFCSFILSIFGLSYFHKYSNIAALFFLDDAFSVNIPSNNGAAWYINVMFWGYIFFYCICKIFDSEKRRYIIALIIFYAYSVLCDKLHLYNQPQMSVFTTIPMLRGIAGMGLGYLIADFYTKDENKNQDNSKYKIILWSCLEIISISLLFKIAIIKKLDTAFPVLIISFICAFYCFLYKKGILSRCLDSKYTSILGKYCFSIYMMQETAFPILNKWIWNNPKFGAMFYPIENITGGDSFDNYTRNSCILYGGKACTKVYLTPFSKGESLI